MKTTKLPEEINKISEENISDAYKYTLVYKDTDGKRKYSIKISKKETNILIEANPVEDSNILYKIELSLNDFYQLSNRFKMFQNLDEIFKELQNIFTSKKASVMTSIGKFSENRRPPKTKKDYFNNLNFFLILNLDNKGGIKQEINIELNKNKINKENDKSKNKILKNNEFENEIKENINDRIILLKKIEDLENLIKAQNAEIKKLKNIEVEQKNIIEKLNNIETAINEQRFKNEKINNLEKELNILKKEIVINNLKNGNNSGTEETLTNKSNNMILNKINSKIINKAEELEFLENRLKYNEVLKKRNVIYKLLYRVSENGNDIQSFHSKCDNIKGTLIIIKTTKGMKFGGYTEQIWNSNKNDSTSRKDGKGICFCFSLDLFKIYNFNDDYKHSICCCDDCGPCFSGDVAAFFEIKNNNGLLFGNTNYTIKSNSFGKVDNDYEFNNGENEFGIIEMEVFQILFDN